jgi:hypothetical protein
MTGVRGEALPGAGARGANWRLMKGQMLGISAAGYIAKAPTVAPGAAADARGQAGEGAGVQCKILCIFYGPFVGID